MVERTELETERLLLRPFRHTDAEDVFGFAASPGWSDYLFNVPRPFLHTDAEAYAAMTLRSSWDNAAFFAVEHRLHGKVIGEVYMNMAIPSGRAEVGYSLSSAYWGQGIMAEALSAVIDWAFGTCGLKKLSATVVADNKRSKRVLTKVGMQLEGTLRRHDNLWGRRVDIEVYGLLTEEWRNG